MYSFLTLFEVKNAHLPATPRYSIGRSYFVASLEISIFGEDIDLILPKGNIWIDCRWDCYYVEKRSAKIDCATRECQIPSSILLIMSPLRLSQLGLLIDVVNLVVNMVIFPFFWKKKLKFLSGVEQTQSIMWRVPTHTYFLHLASGDRCLRRGLWQTYVENFEKLM